MFRFDFHVNVLPLCALLLSGSVLMAADRIVTPVDSHQTVVLTGQMDPRARSQNDLGRVEPSMRMSHMTLLLKAGDGLEVFLRQQQEPASPNYHRWLTPEQFGERFGASASDIAKLTAWIESQGLQVNDVARGRHWITFSGTAGQVSRAFQTEIHRYRVDGRTHFANALAPSIPTAFEKIVGSIRGLTDFGLKPMSIAAKRAPDYNAGGSHYLAPDDVATIYNVAPFYSAGYTGKGQKIVVVGQTGIDPTDIQLFRTRFKLPASDPQVVLYGDDPGTTGDLPEADLDIEWSGAMAREATIVYVYAQYVDLAAMYAVDQNLAPVMTMSYGGCEPWDSPTYRILVQQANAQGITWMAASGDWGAATCDYLSSTPEATKGLSVSFPASVPEVTAVGGTEFDEGSGTYWDTANSASSGSALSWIPEKVWNDSEERNDLAATGGGVSVLFEKPFWQTGPGVPDNNARNVPDVSFSSSPDHDGYLVYTSGSLYVFGGTSVASPVFAGMVALLNQYVAAQTPPGPAGQGNINPMLYRLAQAHPEAFHDVVSGDNTIPCAQSSPDCVNGRIGYSATPGYDLTTGLGSVDAWELAAVWKAGAATTTTLTATPSNYALADTVQLTATVAPASGTTAPTGSVTFLTDGNPLGSADLTASGSTAAATVSVPGALLASGDGAVNAYYGGDVLFSGSTGSTTTKLTLPATGTIVAPAVFPFPVPEQSSPYGSAWPYTVSLTEKSGVGATLTKFTVDGVRQDLSYWSDTEIKPNGTISADLAGHGLMPPVDRVFHFEGIDANSVSWTQDLTVPFVGAATANLAPTVAIVANPGTVHQDTTQDASCQWKYDLTLQEQGGFEVEIIGLYSTKNDYSDQLQQLFGTTQLAPFGMLHATICRGGIRGTEVLTLLGFTGIGTIIDPSLRITFDAPPVTQTPAAVNPTSVKLSAPDPTQAASATVDLSFTGGAPTWTASVLPANRTTSWLTVSPASGAGPAQLQLQAAAGLSRGVYRAFVTILPDGGAPPVITVPVTYVVGASPDVVVDHASNAASYAQVYVPGMAMAVFGTNLAPQIEENKLIPFRLRMQGVSVTVNGVSAPLYYVSPTQLNIQIPYETTLGTAVLGINNNGKVTSFEFPVTMVGPGIYADLNTALVPVSTGQQGQALESYITGAGLLTPTEPSGAAPPDYLPVDWLPAPALPVKATVGGVPADLEFVGVPSWAVGTTQINFKIPLNAPLGPQPLVITVGDVPSAPVTLTVTAAPAP